MLRVISALLLLASWARLGAAVCPLSHPVAPGDTLRGLAQFYFGESQYWPGIVLATNSRPGEGFGFVSNLNDISKLSKICIPELAEAQRWRSIYQMYLDAILSTALPEPWEAAKQLVEFRPDQELRVATWIRENQIDRYRDSSGKWLNQAPEEIWVTVEPYLQKFCSAYAAAHDHDREELTLRLEQRLGLPPVANKTKFLEIRLDQPDLRVIFRPCMNPSTNTTDCPLGPPPAEVEDSHKNWIYKQYYSSYGVARLSSFPWTALGYTFDWASGPEGGGTFQRLGESEFVVKKGAPIEVLRAVDTGEYCK